MRDDKFKQVSKYALILSITYLFEFVFNRYVRHFNLDPERRINEILLSNAPYLLTLLLNIITAIIVYRDIVTKGIRTKYVIVATVLYRPIGVVVFLLYSIIPTGQRTED
jgi:hypothetical protein